MIPRCNYKHCRKTAEIKVGTIYNYKDSGATDVYDDLWMCSEHALKFIKKWGNA